MSKNNFTLSIAVGSSDTTAQARIAMGKLKDIGKGVTDGVKKLAEPFVKEAVGLPEAKKLLQGLKAGSKKIIKGDK